MEHEFYKGQSKCNTSSAHILGNNKTLCTLGIPYGSGEIRAIFRACVPNTAGLICMCNTARRRKHYLVLNCLTRSHTWFRGVGKI